MNDIDTSSVQSSKKPKLEHVADLDDVVQLGGTGLKLDSYDMVPFTKAFAQEILEAEEFAADRHLNNDWVEKLLLAMQRGTFLPEQANIVICKFGKKVFRMNGQHTCWARFSYDNPKYRPKIAYLVYKAKTEDDMRRLYASIDRGKARTKANVINSYLYGSSAFIGFSKQVLKQMAQGFSAWMWGFAKASKHDGDEISHLMENEYLGLCLQVGNFLADHSRAEFKHLKRSPVYRAMFSTFKVAQKDSRDFWGRIADGVGLDADDPRLKLRNWLMQNAVNAGRGGGTYKNMVPGEDMFCYCIDAWNAWRAGTKMSPKFRRADKRTKLPLAK